VQRNEISTRAIFIGYWVRFNLQCPGLKTANWSFKKFRTKPSGGCVTSPEVAPKTEGTAI